MRRIWRLGVVAAIATASFALAITRFSDAAEKGCAQRVHEDRSYTVTFLDQPRMDRLQYRVGVTRAGELVTGAEVCVTTYMQGMSAMATTDTADEVAPGTYEVSLIFEMGGAWKGRVLVKEPGRATVSVPLSLQVEVPVEDGTEPTTPAPAMTVPATTTAPPTTAAASSTTVVPSGAGGTPPDGPVAPGGTRGSPGTASETPAAGDDVPAGGGDVPAGGGVEPPVDETLPAERPSGRSPMPPDPP